MIAFVLMDDVVNNNNDNQFSRNDTKLAWEI